jgi:ubiquinone/menaquinone biosynthesis C-methylase UbiE
MLVRKSPLPSDAISRAEALSTTVLCPEPIDMTADPFQAYKGAQRENWKNFAPLAMTTTPSAAKLVRFAGVRPTQKVLDVGCGTGVVSITARRTGAVVTGLDLTPELLAVAKENAAIAELDDITWKEGDAENLPFRDGDFDVVLSQFAHIFAPRPEVAIKEILRVLKSGGRIAFNTWPPELLIGRMFALTASYMPPPSDPKPAPPQSWGDPNIVLQRLGSAVRDVTFDRAFQVTPALSPQHYRHLIEQAGGPIVRLMQTLKDDPARLAQYRHQYDELVSQYFDGNVVRQDFLMTRATKV